MFSFVVFVIVIIVDSRYVVIVGLSELYYFFKEMERRFLFLIFLKFFIIVYMKVMRIIIGLVC